MTLGYGALEYRKRRSCGLEHDIFVEGAVKRVRQVLSHPAQVEVRREVVGGDALGDSLQNAAPRSASIKDRQGLVAIKTTCLNHHHGFGEGSGLDAAYEVVNQLHECAASNRTKMNHVSTKNRKDGLRSGQGGCRTSNEKQQFSGSGMGFGASHRRPGNYSRAEPPRPPVPLSTRC